LLLQQNVLKKKKKKKKKKSDLRSDLVGRWCEDGRSVRKKKFQNGDNNMSQRNVTDGQKDSEG
jgi:hypothetical protein